MRAAASLLGLALVGLGGCSSASEPKLLAGYRPTDIPPECRAEVYKDPTVRSIMVAGAGSAGYLGENQDRLAFAQEEAARKCLREKGLMPQGGVEPVKRQWYKSPF